MRRLPTSDKSSYVCPICRGQRLTASRPPPVILSGAKDLSPGRRIAAPTFNKSTFRPPVGEGLPPPAGLIIAKFGPSRATDRRPYIQRINLPPSCRGGYQPPAGPSSYRVRKKHGRLVFPVILSGAKDLSPRAADRRPYSQRMRAQSSRRGGYQPPANRIITVPLFHAVPFLPAILNTAKDLFPRPSRKANGRAGKSLPLEGKVPQCAHWGG